MATIIVLEHRQQAALGVPYMAYELGRRWAAGGHRVTIYRGYDNPPPGDLAILNIDLTRVPEAYRAIIGRYPRVVNGRVFDIGKRSFSEIALEPSSPWTGPVIVKTDANHGGLGEQWYRRLASQAGVEPDVPAVSWLAEYPVYASLAEVPAQVWSVPDLIVEKFLPEQDERGYYMRAWVFFGDRETSSRFRSNSPVIKSDQIIDREDAEVPEEIRAWRARLGFDFGKFDFVRSGECYRLLDVNRTPAFPPEMAARPAAARSLDHLAGGLAVFLSGRA